MTKRLYCTDTEGDNLLPDITKMWCMSLTELDAHNNVVRKFTLTDTAKICEMFENPDNMFAMHNGIDFDKPVMEKLFGITVQAEIIDTLFLSWYLYPKRTLHGLESHGEDFGVLKPEVEDWSEQPLSVYVHRCEEDTKIQTQLWRMIWADLMSLYGNVEGCWHAIKHLNFKAKCAALQAKNKWKLKAKECQEADKMFASKMEISQAALQVGMPDVPVYKKGTYPAKPYKLNGELSSSGLKHCALVLKHVDPEEYDFDESPENLVAYKEEIKYISSYKAPNAGSHAQVKSWLFSMGWEPESFKHKRDKVTNKVVEIPQIKNQETKLLCDSIVRLIPYCPALEHLRELSIVTHRKSVTNGFLKNVDDDGFVIAGVQGLTNTLRFKHRTCLNIPSLRAPYGKLIRSLLTVKSEETELCGSDMSSLEDRCKMHYMYQYDPEFVEEMSKPGYDPHLTIALAAGMVTQDDVDFYKSFDKENHTDAEKARYDALSLIRHAGKGCNYAATYGAQAPTISRAAGVELSVGKDLYEGYWEKNHALIKIADNCKVKQSRGMKWLWNPVAKLWIFLKNDKDRFSTLNQSTGTYAFDRWIFHVLEQREQLTAQFHDEGVWELKKGHRDGMSNILNTAMDRTNDELQLNRRLGCDIDFGETYAEIH